MSNRLWMHAKYESLSALQQKRSGMIQYLTGLRRLAEHDRRLSPLERAAYIADKEALYRPQIDRLTDLIEQIRREMTESNNANR